MRFVLLAACAFAAVPAAAAPLLDAAPTQVPADQRVMVRGAAFTCANGTCTARSSDSRPLVLCQRLAREVGTLARFSVDGVDMAPAELERCNAKAR